MRPALSAVLISVVVLLLAGGAYALLATTTSGGAIVISGDRGCRSGHLGMSGNPRGEPVHEVVLNITEGEAFELEQPAGEWVAKLMGEGVVFAQRASLTPDGYGWTEGLTRGWCHGRAGTETYATRGEGQVTIRYWLGEAGGLRVG